MEFGEVDECIERLNHDSSVCAVSWLLAAITYCRYCMTCRDDSQSQLACRPGVLQIEHLSFCCKFPCPLDNAVPAPAQEALIAILYGFDAGLAGGESFIDSDEDTAVLPHSKPSTARRRALPASLGGSAPSTQRGECKGLTCANNPYEVLPDGLS